MELSLVFLASFLGFLAIMLLPGLVTMTLSKQIGGLVSASSALAVTDNEGVLANPSVPAAQPGSLTTYTDSTHGTLTMTNAGHGITTGQRVDLYWSGGQAFDVTVGTVAGTSVPITVGGSGSTALPVATTVINVGICTSVPFNMTGNNLSAIVVASSQQAGYIVVASNSADLWSNYVATGGSAAWFTGDVGTNPLSGDTPTKVWFSHGNTANAVTTMQAAAIYH